MPLPRMLAIDWSGARIGATRKIWLAEAIGDHLVRLESGRDRAAIADHLIAEADRDPNLVVGLDFAFAFPAWYLDWLGVASGPALWALAATEAETWLAVCDPPFWGRPGRRRPAAIEHHRQTERHLMADPGPRPKSVFQIGGAGAVGTGSLRGFPILARLHAVGFAVWPFDPPGFPLVVEIYPRLLTGPVVKANPAARAAYLLAHYPALSPDTRARAASSEDAFDAAVSALVMARHVDTLMTLPPATDPDTRREGIIWRPGTAA